MNFSRLIRYALFRSKTLLNKSRAWQIIFDTSILPLEIYKAKKDHKNRFGETLKITNPKTFNEHIQNLKLFNRKKIHETMADKISMRDFVKSRIGSNHLTNLIWTGQSLKDLNKELLPNNFIIKSNHGSGDALIIKSGDKVDWTDLERRTSAWLNSNHSMTWGEWQYRWIKPKLLVEELLLTSDGEIPCDYKLFMLNGKFIFAQIDFDRFTNHKRSFFDVDFKKLPFSLEYPQYDLAVKKPKNWKKFIDIAEILSKDERFLRVDFYDCDLPIVGELTLHPEAGRGRFNPAHFDLIIGKYFSEKIN